MTTSSDRSTFVRRYGSSLVVLIAGLATSILTLTLQRSAEIVTSRQRFHIWAEQHRDNLQRTVDAQLRVLYWTRALFDSSESVEPQEFERFVARGLQVRTHVERVGWLPRIPMASAQEFVEAARSRWDMNVSVPTTRVGSYVYPVLFRQPADSSASNDVHPETMQRADLARAAALVPMGATGDVPDTLVVYLPVYEADVLEGFLRMNMSFASLSAAFLDDARRHGIEVTFTPTAQAQPTRTSDSVLQLPNRFVPWVSAAPFEWVGSIDIAGTRVGLSVASTADYVWRPRLAGIWMWFAVATVMSLIAAAVAYYLSLGRLRLQSLARSLTSEIEERRTSQQRLQETEARFRLLVENSPDAVVLYRHGRIGYINPAGVRLLRAHTQADILGRDVLDFIHADDREFARERIDITTRERRVLPPAIEHFQRLDGTLVEAEVLTVPFDVDGETTLHITARDITQRRQSEAERGKLEDALRQAQKLEAVGTLAGGIAHDFNNILSAIVGNTRLLFDDLPESHPARHSVAEIRRATQRARDLVKRLLAFSRHQETQRTAVALAPLLKEVQQLLRATLPAGVRLDVDVAEDIPPVLADATQLHQVFVNLCTNAWQSMTSTSGTIAITAKTLPYFDAQRESAAPLVEETEHVRVEVRDDGSGIAPDLLEHIFEPFFTTKPPGEGSGLGLAVVHGIIQSHGGAICVESQLGRGTSFFVYLPVTNERPTSAVTTAPERVRGQEQHVLYVDDEESLVFLVERTLRRAGFRCTGVTDVQAALDELRKDPTRFDLVITDLNMPGMSGLELAREISQLRRELPVLITSGYVRAPDVAVARELGFDLVLKPDTVDELAAVVQRYL